MEEAEEAEPDEEFKDAIEVGGRGNVYWWYLENIFSFDFYLLLLLSYCIKVVV